MSYISTQFDLLDQNRRNVISILQEYSLDQWNTIPDGFSNNLLWNAAHLLVTQQLLMYGLSGQKMLVSEEWVETYRKGSRPTAKVEEKEANAILNALIEVPEKSRRDYQDGLFTEYRAYETSFGTTLHSVEEAISFNNLHEGLHLGVIMSMRKFV